ncbi:heme NO-binding domain-containing protein [Pseudooceanicola sp. MF1-13]|uniref:heme NO-binding domain-containing protein n=1 Tax=Pseudooceanicola sp. MF1-13 TaxID=3379095 RepID=UPI003892A9A7
MHGLMNRAIQCFVRDTYGPQAWSQVVSRAGLTITDFEAMLTYDDPLTDQVLDAICDVLSKPRATVLEDIGTYLVSDPKLEAPRRLLRFAGITYEDFLHSLDDLPGRARLAVSDLILPRLELRSHPGGRYMLMVDGQPKGFGHVMIGILRAMADDYGALVMLDHRGTRQSREEIEVTLVEAAFSEGRAFSLGISGA